MLHGNIDDLVRCLTHQEQQALGVLRELNVEDLAILFRSLTARERRICLLIISGRSLFDVAETIPLKKQRIVDTYRLIAQKVLIADARFCSVNTAIQ